MQVVTVISCEAAGSYKAAGIYMPVFKMQTRLARIMKYLEYYMLILEAEGLTYRFD